MGINSKSLRFPALEEAGLFSHQGIKFLNDSPRFKKLVLGSYDANDLTVLDRLSEIQVTKHRNPSDKTVSCRGRVLDKVALRPNREINPEGPTRDRAESGPILNCRDRGKDNGAFCYAIKVALFP